MYVIMGSVAEREFMEGFEGLNDLVAKRKSIFPDGTTLISFLLDKGYIETACNLIVSDYAEDVLFDYISSEGCLGYTLLLLSGNQRIFHAFCTSHSLAKVSADKLQAVFRELVAFYAKKTEEKQELGYNPYNVFRREQFGDMDLMEILRTGSSDLLCYLMRSDYVFFKNKVVAELFQGTLSDLTKVKWAYSPFGFDTWYNKFVICSELVKALEENVFLVYSKVTNLFYSFKLNVRSYDYRTPFGMEKEETRWMDVYEYIKKFEDSELAGEESWQYRGNEILEYHFTPITLPCESEEDLVEGTIFVTGTSLRKLFQDLSMMVVPVNKYRHYVSTSEIWTPELPEWLEDKLFL